MSPGFSDLLSLWDTHHLNNAQRVGVPLLALLADMLRVLPGNPGEAQGFVHLQLDGAAKALVQRRMRAVYSHLTCSVRTRHNAALALLTAIARRHKQMAWEVFRGFDFSLKELPALAAPRKVRSGGKEKSGGDETRKTETTEASNEWPGLDPIGLSTRHNFVEFALSLLESGDNTLTKPVLARRALFGNALRYVASDPPALATKILKTLRDVVLSSDGGVPARLRAALCGDASLEQMALISGTDAGEDDDDDEERQEACVLAHDVLSKLCLDPAHGVCPASALGRWVPKETRAGGDTQSTDNAGGQKPDATSSTKHSQTLIRLLRKLRPTESAKHAELLLNICEQRPRIAALYLPHATYSLDPRPSVPWLAAAALLGEVAACASLDPTPPRSLPAEPGDAEGAAFVKAAMPASLTKQGLAKGLTHESGLVRSATLTLLLRVLCAVRVRVARLDEAAVAAESTSGGENGASQSNAQSTAFTQLAQRARGAALAVLPDPQALLAVLATKNASEAGESNESLENRIHALNALAEYCELVGPEGVASANIDPGKTLPADPLSLPQAELAATIGFLAAARGVPVLARRPLSDADANGGDACVSRASLAAAAGDAAAATTTATRRAAAAGDSARGANLGGAQGHVLAILRVAARAPVLAIRRDAAAVAGAHVASSGAFETHESAETEAGAWIGNLPNHADADAACLFLAETVSAVSRRPGADADAAAAALRNRFGQHVVKRWPRVTRWRVRWTEDNDNGDADTAMNGVAAVTSDSADSTNDPIVATGATGTDLEFSGLTAHALGACVKVLGSAKRSEEQRVAVSNYVAKSVFDVLTQQQDPVPLAGLVLETLRDAPGAKVNLAKDGKKSEKSESDGKKNKSTGAASSGGGGGGGGAGVDTHTFRLSDYSALVSLVSFAKVIVEGDTDAASGEYSVGDAKALHWSDEILCSPAAVVCDVLSNPKNTKKKSPVSSAAVDALDSAAVKQACGAAAERTPAEELPSAARKLAFWCAFASADADRNAGAGGASDDDSTSRGFVSLVGACGALLARARDVAHDAPEASRAARRAILGSPALANGFTSRGAAFTRALRDVALDDLSVTGPDAPGAPYAAAAAAYATSALLNSVGDDEGYLRRLGTALAAVPLARHADSRGRRLLAEAAARASNETADPARRALAAEAAAAVLSRLSSPTTSVESAESPEDAHEALSLAFAAALTLAATGDDAGGGRASHAAATALAAAKTLFASTLPDFAAVASGSAALARAVAATVNWEDSPSTAQLAEALAAASPAHADRLLALVAEALNSCGVGRLVSLLPAVRVALERKVAVAVQCSYSATDDDASDREFSTGMMQGLPFPDKTFPGIPGVDASGLGTVSSAAVRVARAFGEFSCAFLSDSFGRRDELHDWGVINTCLETHAPGTLAAAHALAPLDSRHSVALKEALLPTGGWWVDKKEKDDGTKTNENKSASAFCRAAAARLLFGGDLTRAPVSCSVSGDATDDASIRATAQYAACLLHTTRVLSLVVPVSAAARAEKKQQNRGVVLGTSKTAIAARLEQNLCDDLGALLDSRGCFFARSVTPALVAAARGFTNAQLRRRYPSSLASLALVRRVASALVCGDAGVALSGVNDASKTRVRCTPLLAHFARDAFEHIASHSATARVLLHPEGNAVLPPVVSAMATPLASLLPAAHFSENVDDETLDEALVADADGDDLVDEETHADDDLVVDTHATARATKLEVVGALHALWTLHGDAFVCLGDTNDDLSVPFSMELGDDDAANDDEDIDDLPPAHHAVWRAEQSALIPLLAAAHGATLSACDRRLGALLMQMDAAAGGGALREMGYLWGDAAAYLARTNASIVSNSVEDVTRDAACRAFAFAKPSPDAIAAALRAGAFPDARRCAATATRFPHARRSPAPAPNVSHRVSLADEPHSELVSQGLVSANDGAGLAPAFGYDPAWVLPFALAALDTNAVEARDFVAWGLASLAFAATASADETTRAVAFAVLNALQDACDETKRPEAANFRERAQLTALLEATKNGLHPDGPRVDSKPKPGRDSGETRETGDEIAISEIARLPTATAVFAAEAATAALHPAGDTYVITQRAVCRRAALDGEALPVNFLGALNGSGGGGGGDKAETVAVVTAGRGEARALRVWVLRLLLASLRGGPEDARLFRKAFAAEVLMSHRTASLSSDPYARQLALAVVARAAETPAAARALVEGSGLVPWLASAVTSACRPSQFRVGEAASSRAAAAATATTALAKLAAARGAFYGGPSGTAVDFLSATRDIRNALAPLYGSANGNGNGNGSSGASIKHTLTMDAATLTVCRAALLPALHLHAAVAKRLTRRLGEVLDVAETAALCRAVVSNTRNYGKDGSNTPSFSKDSDKHFQALREAMLEVVVTSSGSGRDPDGFGARSLPGVQKNETSEMANAAGSALCEVTSWALNACALSSDPQGWSARVLTWATTSLERGGHELVAAVASRREGGGGGVKFAATLGALRDGSSAGAGAGAAHSMARAGTALLRAVANHTNEDSVCVGDLRCWQATRRGAYRELLCPGGALETLMLGADENVPTDNGNARAVVSVAAALCGTLIRCASAGEAPVAFVKHVADTTNGLTDFTILQTLVEQWASKREWPDDDPAWRLGNMLHEAGLCAAPKPKTTESGKRLAPPLPARVRAPSKRRRVEV